MRKSFFKKLEKIEDLDPSSIDISSQKIEYVEEGIEKELKISHQEKTCLDNIYPLFFLDSSDDFVPQVETEDIILKTYAYYFLDFLDHYCISKLNWLREEKRKFNREEILGPSSPFQKALFSSSCLGDYLSFISDPLPSEGKTLYLSLVKEEEGLGRIVKGGFPLSYLSGSTKDPSLLNWESVPSESFTCYIREYASEHEKKELLLEYL